MRHLPRRPIEPLSPPPGSFDAVLARARFRRHRRAGTALTVTAVFLAGIAGGMSLDGGVRETIVGLGLTNTEDTASPTQQPNTSAVVTPQVDETKKPAHRKSPDDSLVAVAPPPGPRMMTGVAVDTAGGPIAGLYVYPGRDAAQPFLATRRPLARTAADGSFSLPCPGTAVLLSPWRVNTAAGADGARAVWAATFVGGGTEAASAPDAPCSTAGRVVKTTVLPGSTLEGTVTMPVACADAPRPLWLWLHNDRSLTVRLSDVESGGTFTIGGLPPGQHTVGADGQRTMVTVGGGTTFTSDVTFSCEPGSPPPSPEPTPTDTATPPSPISTPTPTGSAPPTDPTPSGSSSPPPTSTGSAPTEPG